jgi:metal-responsive CopG/Arc/MetJ family transcriptional regulator
MVKELRAVRINGRHLEELKKLAKKEGETVSFLIQQAIREFLERKRKWQDFGVLSLAWRSAFTVPWF